MATNASARPLTSRPLDLLYFVFFLIHVPATVLNDLPAIYPRSLAPSFLFKLPEFYVAVSQDPLMGGVMGLAGKSEHFVWFKSFLLVELFFQLPTFLLGMRGLLRDSKSIYVLLLIYGASTATTVWACVAVILTTPLTTSETIAAGVTSVTPEQRLLLLSSYVPFFIIPLLMTIDMAKRISRLVSIGLRSQDAKKSY